MLLDGTTKEIRLDGFHKISKLAWCVWSSYFSYTYHIFEEKEKTRNCCRHLSFINGFQNYLEEIFLWRNISGFLVKFKLTF